MKHLSEEQFVEWASGERSEEASQHLRECAACLEEVRQLNAALEGFKAEIKERADERVAFTGAQVRALANQPKPSRSLWKILPVPALAAAAVLVVMLVKPVPVSQPTPQPNVVASNDAADDALLLAINSDVYRSAPTALHPAATLNTERNALLASSQRKK